MLTLWDFSLAYYSVPGVAQVCLWLQDDHGVDVNLLMFSAWAGHGCGLALARQDFEDAELLVRKWRTSVVQPLRAARRGLKGESLAGFHAGAPALRQRVKDLEVEAERLEQAQLEQFLLERRAPREPSADLAARNLAGLLAAVPPSDAFYLQRLQNALRSL